MAIYEYNSHNPHGGGFEGLRVVVSCCRSGIHQRYFNFRHRGKRVTPSREKAMRREAKAIDKEWRQQQAREQKGRRDEARPNRNADSPTSTGVGGIRMTFTVTRKHRAGRNVHYYAPAFVVHGSNDNRVFTRTIRVRRGEVMAGWAQAVRFYCEQKGIEGAGFRRLLRRRPPVARFEVVRQDMNKRLGHKIPKEKVPQ
ncbi:hypothetical protein [Halofilum ochraceum]|uniref:hypothetical protein n=1 Tax=Halofilum ochraceum TaxID=1611323 RepID=UPI0008DA9986|nr:hypothetical protein [Halofilum ochraceum]